MILKPFRKLLIHENSLPNFPDIAHSQKHFHEKLEISHFQSTKKLKFRKFLTSLEYLWGKFIVFKVLMITA